MIWLRALFFISALLIVLGVALLTGATSLVAYAAFLAIIYQAFVRLYEEPRLRRTFGDAYARYCSEVPRWFPRS